MRKFIIAAVLILAGAVTAHAVTPNFYSQSGGGNGLSCGTPHSIAQLNANADGLVAGNTAHLCGVISTPLVIPIDGTAGNVFTILFESGASFSTATLTTGTAFLGKSSGNYIVVDGGTNGIIELTANGTGQNQNDAYGVHFSTCNHCEIKNLTVQNFYVRSSTTDTCVCGSPITIDGGSNNHIHNNVVHDAESGIHHGISSGGSNIEIDHNISYHGNWQYSMIGGGSTNSDSLLIHDNEGYDSANWDDTTGANRFHHNRFLFSTSASTAGGTVTNLQIYNNYFHGTSGATTTAQIFLECDGDANVSGNVFNNLLTATDAGDTWSNGQLYMKRSTLAHFIGGVYNNTFYWNATAGQGIALGMDTSNVVTMNGNIFYNGRIGGSPGMTLVADKNWYYQLDPTGWSWGGADTFAQWKTDCACDANSSNAVDPNLNLTSFIPNGGSGTIGFSPNLSGLGITPLNSDKNGNARGGGNWTAGALNSGGGTTPTVPSSILPLTLAAGTVGIPYPAITFSTVGGKAPYSYIVTGAPPGVPLLQSGTPTTSGAYSPKVTATDSNGKSVAQGYTLTINAAAPPTSLLISATPISLTFSGAVGGSIACQPITLDDSGSGPMPLAISSNTTWLTVTPATGNTKLPLVACVKTAGLIAGTFTGTVTAKQSAPNSSGQTASNSPLNIPVSLTLTGVAPNPLPGKGTCTTITPYTIDVNAVITFGASVTTCARQ